MVALSNSGKILDAYRCFGKAKNAIEVARQREFEMVFRLTFSQQLVTQKICFYWTKTFRPSQGPCPPKSEKNVLDRSTTFKVRVLENLSLV